MVVTPRSAKNQVSINHIFGLTSSVNAMDGSTSSTVIEEAVTANTTPISLSSILHYGQIHVEVSKNEGIVFTNPTDFEVKVTFIPDINGKWLVQMPIGHEEGTQVLLNSRGQSVDTDVQLLDPSLQILNPSYPVGALLVKQEGQYEEVGVQTTINLGAKESANLFCNYYFEDNELYVSDNTDSITIWWLLEVVQEIPTRGEFTVDASLGYLFSNNFDRTLTFSFLPEGKWQIFPTGQSIEYVGYTTGYTEAADTYLLPGSPAGCLLAGRGSTIKVETNDLGLGSGDLVSLKDQSIWSLDPGETILFVANGDLSHATKHENGQNRIIDWTFEKHSGEITVKWTVVEVS